MSSRYLSFKSLIDIALITTEYVYSENLDSFFQLLTTVYKIEKVK